MLVWLITLSPSEQLRPNKPNTKGFLCDCSLRHTHHALHLATWYMLYELWRQVLVISFGSWRPDTGTQYELGEYDFQIKDSSWYQTHRGTLCISCRFSQNFLPPPSNKAFKAEKLSKNMPDVHSIMLFWFTLPRRNRWTVEKGGLTKRTERKSMRYDKTFLYIYTVHSSFSCTPMVTRLWCRP